MVPSVTTILRRLKTAWAAQLQPDAIHTACQEAGYTSWRNRLLNPVTTVQLFLLQIIHGNTACQHLPHLSGLRFSASAYCQARAKLPLPVLTHLLERLGHAAQPALAEEALALMARACGRGETTYVVQAPPGTTPGLTSSWS